MVGGTERDVTVSVIVPVRDRREMLAELLVALDKQTYRSFEVVVVDDGSLDGSGDLARASIVSGWPVTVVRGNGEGAVRARQRGVDRARGAIFGFIDSDCLPDPAWLEQAVAAMGDGAELVNGLTRPVRTPKPLERSMASGTEGLYPTCNVLYTRALYERLGGFDSAAASRWGFRLTRRARGLGFGEDTLLAWQAVRSGADVRFVPACVVEHHVLAPDLKEMVSRVTQTAAFPALIKEVPELRQTLLWHRVMLGDSSRLAVYAALAAMAGRRPRLVALAVLWWALQRLRGSAQPISERVAWLPAELALDVATSGALVVGSVRARSVVL